MKLDTRESNAKIFQILMSGIIHRHMAFRTLLIKLLFLFTLASFFFGCQVVRGLDIFSSKQHGIYHTVQEKQTLYAIARVYDVDVNRLSESMASRIRRNSKWASGYGFQEHDGFWRLRRLTADRLRERRTTGQKANHARPLKQWQDF